MDQITVPFIDRIHPKSNKFAADVENKATGDSKLNDSPSKDSKELQTKYVDHRRDFFQHFFPTSTFSPVSGNINELINAVKGI